MRLPVNASEVRPPVDDDSLRFLEREFGGVPGVLVEVLTVSDGFRVDDWVFYSANEVVERNKLYEVQGDAPGWLAVADNGGGQFLLCQADDRGGYLAGMSSCDSREPLCSDLAGWVESGCPGVRTQSATPTLVEVSLVGAGVPAGVLVEVRRAFSIDRPVREMVDGLRREGRVVLGTMHYAKALSLGTSLSELARTFVVTRSPGGTE